MSYWQLGEGNYWGHNAIIRVARVRRACAACRCCRARAARRRDHEPRLRRGRAAAPRRLAGLDRGRPRRAATRSAAEALDFAARDRRWCQGNMQHLRLARRSSGLHPLSSLHLFNGIIGYLASPLWLILLTLSTADILTQTIVGHNYFLPGYNLFPNWPVSKTAETISLFGVTIGILLVPKLYSLILTMSDGRLRRGFGATGKLLLSAFLELLFSMLLAPAMMLFHTHFVVATLMGRSVQWNAQPRGERGLTFREAAGRN